MALPLPQGKNIQIYKRILDSKFTMSSMEAATDHYSIGLIIHGDRTIITPDMTFECHSGDINTMAPFLYHRTIPGSTEYYESILIKFSADFVKPFVDNVGVNVLEKIYELPIKKFKDKVISEKIFALAIDMLNIIEKETPDFYDNFLLQNMLFQLLLCIYENDISTNDASKNRTPLSPEIMDAVYYIESNYMSPLKIKDVAEVSGYSIAYFSRLFQKQLGVPFSEYCCNVRLKHAQHKLLATDKSITEIALETGFVYPGNLTSCFKKHFGITPLIFRKQSR